MKTKDVVCDRSKGFRFLRSFGEEPLRIVVGLLPSIRVADRISCLLRAQLGRDGTGIDWHGAMTGAVDNVTPLNLGRILAPDAGTGARIGEDRRGSWLPLRGLRKRFRLSLSPAGAHPSSRF